MHQDIYNNIVKHDKLKLCRIIFENVNNAVEIAKLNKVLPFDAHNYLNAWQIDQMGSNSSILMKDNLFDLLPSNTYINNTFLNYSNAYSECLDNLLIVGLTISAKIHVFQDLYNSYNGQDTADRFEFYTNIDKLYKES